MAGVDEVEDAYISFCRMCSMKTTSVLLECSLPGDRHCQHQSIERWMVEPFANQSTCGEQDARRIWRKRIQVGDQAPALLLRPAAMEDKGCHLSIQSIQD